MDSSLKNNTNYLDILSKNESHLDNIFNSSINAVTEISRFPRGTGKFNVAAGILGATLSLVSVGRTVYSAYGNWKDAREYTITIAHPDTAYDVVQDWVSELVDPSDIHELRGSALPYVPKDKRDSSHKFIRFEFSQEMSVPFVFKGHPVVISAFIDEPSISDNSNGNTSPESSARNRVSRGVRTITLSARTVEGYTELGIELERRIKVSMDSLTRPPKIFMSDKWGDFTARVQPPRPLNSVILSGNTLNSIKEHVSTFLDSEKRYEEMNMPYHTGLLLYGPPGTGKTSIVKGLSSEFSMDIYHTNLRSMEDDQQLFDEFASIPPRSLILLEDIDVATPSVGDRVRGDGDIESSGITPSGLLNVLDGTMSPYGSVIIMTTNNLEYLDPAVIRAGRIDFKAKIDFMDNEQLLRTCQHYLGRIPKNLPVISVENEISSSEVTGVFRNHINDLENIDEELVELIMDKMKEDVNV